MKHRPAAAGLSCVSDQILSTSCARGCSAPTERARSGLRRSGYDAGARARGRRAGRRADGAPAGWQTVPGAGPARRRPGRHVSCGGSRRADKQPVLHELWDTARAWLCILYELRNTRRRRCRGHRRAHSDSADAESAVVSSCRIRSRRPPSGPPKVRAPCAMEPCE